MRLIPIHDATAPISCTATGAEIQGRIRQIEHLRRDVTRIERTEHGLLLHFPNDPGIHARLRTFSTEEKGCCAFWGFDVTADADELTLRWDGPPDVAGFFEKLLRWFESDDPLTADFGLL